MKQKRITTTRKKKVRKCVNEKPIFPYLPKDKSDINQSVENAGVAFVKGAKERNEFFLKNKQTVIHVYDEQVRRNKAKD